MESWWISFDKNFKKFKGICLKKSRKISIGSLVNCIAKYTTWKAIRAHWLKFDNIILILLGIARINNILKNSNGFYE